MGKSAVSGPGPSAGKRARGPEGGPEGGEGHPEGCGAVALADELLWTIFQGCSPKELLGLSLVCKAWRALIRNEVRPTLRIEKKGEVARMAVFPQAHFVVNEALVWVHRQLFAGCRPAGVTLRLKK